MKKSLIIMAGGLGSRYGGLKQIDGFGPHGETIMEYSIFDALRSGADQIIIVIKREFEEDIKRVLGENLVENYPIFFAYQDMDSFIPEGFDTSHRLKPRGTGHAVLVCKEYISGPFVVINADDWYGFEGMKTLFGLLDGLQGDDFAMIGYALQNTMADSGSVNRGICTLSDDYLTSITENHGIYFDKENGYCVNDLGERIDPNNIVSINFWGFTKDFFDRLEELFAEFIEQYGSDPKKEFYIPTVCNYLLQGGIGKCIVKTSSEQRSGVTNKEDKPLLQKFLQEKIAQGYYPGSLRK